MKVLRVTVMSQIPIAAIDFTHKHNNMFNCKLTGILTGIIIFGHLNSILSRCTVVGEYSCASHAAVWRARHVVKICKRRHDGLPIVRVLYRLPSDRVSWHLLTGPSICIGLLETAR